VTSSRRCTRSGIRKTARARCADMAVVVAVAEVAAARAAVVRAADAVVRPVAAVAAAADAAAADALTGVNGDSPRLLAIGDCPH
jgi:hypothetical protein